MSIEDRNYIAFKIAANNVTPFDLFFTNEEGESLQFSYSSEKQDLFFSRKNTAYQISGEGDSSMEESDVLAIDTKKALSVQIFLDRSSIEIFINENETITSTFYVQKSFSLLQLNSQTEHLLEDLALGNIE
ncbi:GH32 C-terminal domain-containing protein [Tetragenococcus halophilus]|uniref:GH32 C-terminal domain-containing protein n=1 Tax=Tetragenococcus halophilus TaxID=51669 RepID=UPI00102F3959|nr:GH32 C-terminal domain-containing protein [Tetragenococcus halophilus]